MSTESIMRVKRMSKWDKWLSNQNEVTQIYFRNKMKEGDPIIIMSVLVGICFGFLAGILVGL
mgnify:FL=1|jgi:hypothetical protein